MTKNLVSVIIPIFNRAHLIGQTLDSLISQTYNNWECILVDDGSTDNTFEVLEEYRKKDKRIQYFKRPDTALKGANTCRNIGCSLAKGTFVKWFDSDDLMRESAIEIQVNYLLEHTSLDMCVAYASYFNDNISKLKLAKPKVLESKDVLYDYIKTNLFFSVGGPLWRAEYLKNTKILFNENSSKLQDTEFHYNHLRNGLNFKFIDKSLFYYRSKQSDRITEINSNKNLLSIYNYWQHVLFTVTCINKNNQSKILLFLANNLSLLFFRIVINNSTFISRLKIIRKYSLSLFKAFNFVGVNYLSRIKVMFGIVSTLFISKGLKLFKLL